jgi:hypothetical protein
MPTAPRDPSGPDDPGAGLADPEDRPDRGKDACLDDPRVGRPRPDFEPEGSCGAESEDPCRAPLAT